MLDWVVVRQMVALVHAGTKTLLTSPGSRHWTFGRLDSML